MKISILKLLVTPLLIFSCSNNTDTEVLENEKQSSELKVAQKSLEEEANLENTYYEEHLYAYYLESTITELYVLKEAYLLKIEQGDEDYIEKLELLQKQIEENERILKYVRIRPVMPKLPPPPVPCPKKTISCRISFEHIDFILFHNNIKEVSIKLVTEEGEEISENSQLFPAENFEGFPAVKLDKKDYRGNAILSIDKYDVDQEKKISYSLKIYIE